MGGLVDVEMSTLSAVFLQECVCFIHGILYIYFQHVLSYHTVMHNVEHSVSEHGI